MKSALVTVYDPFAGTNDGVVLMPGDTLDIEAGDGEGNHRTVIAIEMVSILRRSVHLEIRFVGIAHPEQKDTYLFLGDSLDFGSVEDEAGGVQHFASVTLQEVRT